MPMPVDELGQAIAKRAERHPQQLTRFLFRSTGLLKRLEQVFLLQICSGSRCLQTNG
jgi:hypothetical protein